MNFWARLGVEPTTDLKQIKRAYAKELKRCKPEEDAEGYQRLREAFDSAKSYAKNAIKQGDRFEAENQFVDEQQNQALVDNPENSINSIDTQTEHEESSVKMDLSTAHTLVEHSMLENSRVENSRVKNSRVKNHGDEDEPDGQASKSVETPVQEPDVPPFSKSELKRIERRKLRQKLLSDMQKLAAEIFSHDDEKLMIKAFQQLMTSSKVESLEARDILSEYCLDAGASWPKDTMVPAKLFEMIADEFKWFSEAQTDLNEWNLNYLRHRMDARFKFESTIRRSREVFPILSGECQPNKFRRLVLFSKVDQIICDKLNLLLEHHDVDEFPELNKESVEWWVDRQRKNYFKLSHLAVGVFGVVMSLLFGLVLLNFFEYYLSTVEFTIIGIVGFIVGTLMGWVSGAISRSIKEYWNRVIESYWYPLKQNHQFNRLLLLLSVNCFLIAPSLADDVIKLWVYFAGGGLLTLAFGYGMIIMTLLAGLPFYLGYKDGIFDHSMIIVPNWTIVFGILSTFSHYWFMEILPKKVTDWINEQFFLLMVIIFGFCAGYSYLLHLFINLF